MGTGELPEAFEGEERSVAGIGDVMHLVSGRQLLGVVRERQDLRLSGITSRSEEQHSCLLSAVVQNNLEIEGVMFLSFVLLELASISM